MADESALRWETLDRERSHTCSAFEVFTDRVRLPDGSESRFDFVREPPSAVVLGLTMDEEVVVVEEYRHAVGRIALGLPGGSAEPGDEDMSETAARELYEEAGYRAAMFEALLVAEPANGLLDSVRYYFVARGCRHVGETDRDADESMRVRTMRLSELLDLVRRGEVRDERTVTAALMYDAKARAREVVSP